MDVDYYYYYFENSFLVNLNTNYTGGIKNGKEIIRYPKRKRICKRLNA